MEYGGITRSGAAWKNRAEPAGSGNAVGTFRNGSEENATGYHRNARRYPTYLAPMEGSSAFRSPSLSSSLSSTRWGCPSMDFSGKTTATSAPRRRSRASERIRAKIEEW